MKSKTLRLIDHYTKILVEQGEDPNQMPPQEGEQAPQDVQSVTQPEPPDEQETEPLTSQGEDEYITNLISAALFKPSAEDAKTLMNLQNVMQLKRYTNAREEVLPMVLSIINPESQNSQLKQNLSSI